MQEMKLPIHVGIIMDGNGRWATKRALPRNIGHNKGAEAFEKIAQHARQKGIKHLTVFAFSTENFKRPADEVKAIFNLMRSYLNKQKIDRQTHLTFLGDITVLPEDIRKQAYNLENKTRENTQFYLNIAFNYGGRQDILQATKKLAKQAQADSELELDLITEKEFARYLYTGEQPEIDLLIRTSGEQRISNFLLWQSAYAEFVFNPILWPDYTIQEFDNDILTYSKRQRRMGGI